MPELSRKTLETALSGNSELASALCAFLDEGTPLRITSLPDIEAACDALREAFPQATIAYAMKSDPRAEIMQTLCAKNMTVEVNNPNELEWASSQGFNPRLVLYSNPHRLPRDVGRALDHGVTLFVSQGEGTIDDLAAKRKPEEEVKVIIRLLSGNSTGEGFDIDGASPNHPPRYGVSTEEAVRLLLYAREKGLTPYGVCGHVGTQVTTPQAWDNLISSAAEVEKTLREQHNIMLQMVDVGGGFPMLHGRRMPPIREFGSHITHKMQQCFGPERAVKLEMVIEPGTYLSSHMLFLGKVHEVEQRGQELYITTTLGRYNAGLLGDDSPEVAFFTLQEGAIKWRCGQKRDASLFGAVTANSDRWQECLEVPKTLQRGDYIAVRGGAYSVAAQTPWARQEPPNDVFLARQQTLAALLSEVAGKRQQGR